MGRAGDGGGGAVAAAGRVRGIPREYLACPRRCTCRRVFSRSSGATSTLASTPAPSPATACALSGPRRVPAGPSPPE